MVLFVITGGVIIIGTISIVNWGQKKGILNNHRYALIVAIGLGLAWMLAPLVPLIVKNGYSNNQEFMMFWGILSIIVSVCAYIAIRLYKKMKR